MEKTYNFESTKESVNVALKEITDEINLMIGDYDKINSVSHNVLILKDGNYLVTAIIAVTE